jgi:tetratricopeptide (TPR) repeat protein
VVREGPGEDPRTPAEPRRGPPKTPREQDIWRDDGVVGDGGGGRPRTRPTPRRRDDDARRVEEETDIHLPADIREELAGVVGRARGAKLAERLAAAARAYARDRYPEAQRLTKSLVSEVPGSASARELHGLVSYRTGRYREAVRHLEAARELAGDVSQLPVIMDCHRAMGHHRRVEDLWNELRDASPDADVLAEGRLVLAADLADRGRLERATELLVAAGAGRNLRHPAERHVRQWYVLADLAERAGNLARARELFARVVAADPDLADAPARLAALGTATRARRGPAPPRAATTRKTGAPRPTSATRSPGPAGRRAR